MLFNSLTYIVYMLFAVPMVIYGPPALRRFVLVAGSLMFYAFWRIDFTAMILFSAGIDYVAGKYISRTENPKARKRLLALSLIVNFTLLGFFKYAYFLNDTLAPVFPFLPASLSDWMHVHKPMGVEAIILPLGISFYTFESVSYVIDVYRRIQEPINGFWKFMTFVAFWPKLVAGPILRVSEVIPQVDNYERPTRREFLYGLEEIIQGLFKKIVLADTLAESVNAGFDLPVQDLGTLDVWVLAFGFGLQIYFDFSGYSQIALGSARLMGFHFPRNFNWPYIAASARDFWKRWHISLSSWIQDYLYIPLQGVKFRKKGEKGLDTEGEQEASFGRRTFALFTTWFIMGLWHGAHWTYAVWGLWHAMLVFIHRVTEPVRVKLPMAVRTIGGWAWTVPTAMLAWLFFRPEPLDRAAARLFTAFNPSKLNVRTLRENDYLFIFLVFAGFMLVAGLVQLHKKGLIPAPVRTVALAAVNAIMLFWIFLLLRDDVKQFIYFQF